MTQKVCDKVRIAHCSEQHERALIERIVRGSRSEYSVIVERYQRLVFGLIVRMVRDQSLAEDLTQESFVKAYRRLATFRNEARFSSWLSQIALNHTRSYLSSKEGKKRLATDPFRTEDGGTYRSERNLEFRSQLSILATIVSRLPPQFRDVLLLCGVRERSYDEAATILNIPTGTVRSRLHKARKLLSAAYLAAGASEVRSWETSIRQ